MVVNLNVQYQSILGNTLLCSSIINFGGVFDFQNKLELINKFRSSLLALGIEVQRDFNFIEFMENPNNILDWSINGLPSDQTSKINAIISLQSQKYPFIVDPNN